MENLRKILVSSLVVITTFSACKKSSDDFVPYTNSDFNDTEWAANGSSMSSAKELSIKTALSSNTTNATFNALSSSSVDLNANTQLFLPANAYTLNGSDYSGNVTASLISVTKKGDYIRNLISNCTPNPLQETVAAFDLNLFSSSKEALSFKKQNKFSLAYADSFIGLNYNYLYGSLNQNVLSWAIADSTITGGQNLSYNQVSIQGISKPVYQINSNQLGWMAINKNINLGATTTCNVLLPVNFTNKNTAVFAVFKNNNIVLRLTGEPASRSFVATNLPINSDITFVALSYLDNQFYLGYFETLITNNAQYNIKTTTTPISLSSLNSFLDGL